MEHRTWTMVLAAALAAGGAVMASAQDAKDNTAADIAQYREILTGGNPAELWEAAGEELWKEPAGPRQASLEACDLGLGPGVVKGAYAKLSRFFKDTGRVMDAEQRLMYCHITLQGLTKEEVSARPFLSPGKASDIKWLMAYVVSESRGAAIDIPLAHPEEKRVYELGRRIFSYRGGAYDSACATCHTQPGLRIHLQELPDLLTVDGARFAYSTWLGYRVPQGEVCAMQHRLYGCLRQQRFLEPLYGSEVITVLEMFLARNVNGGKMDAPPIKRRHDKATHDPTDPHRSDGARIGTGHRHHAGS